MSTSRPHILLLEPYYGGSHKAFLNGLQRHLDYDFTLLSLPARKWKMRMQLSAPWMAERIVELMQQGHRYDCVVTSTFIDLAMLRSQLSKEGIHLPLAMYFHENQFSYPFGSQDHGQFQFTAINFTSALSADRLAFNSSYNLNSFLDGVRGYLSKAADCDLRHLTEVIRKKATILYPGIEFQLIDRAASVVEKLKGPVIVWNHRWEHDKNPEQFFSCLMDLADEKVKFQLIVLGEQFRHQPPIFAKARQALHARILHFGYVPDRNAYAEHLCQANIVVSTAIHEFFGMAVLEGVRAGCIPLVPDRLSYKELFPQKYRYQDTQIKKRLHNLIKHPVVLHPEEQTRLTEKCSWSTLAGLYASWLSELTALQPPTIQE